MKVLIADDDPTTCLLLRTTLTKLGHDVVQCGDGTAALAVLSSADAPQLAILDWNMPGIDGLDVCRRVRAGVGAYTYVILVSARDTRADVIEALEAEADDFLPKPFHLSELRLRLRAGERVLAMQQRLLHAQEALTYQATHDPLTGLLNRGAIVDQLERELNRVRRGGPPLGVMIADLDHFKAINDGHGHQAGDVVLREAAKRMQAVLRNCDTIGRYGGEEFLILAPGTDRAGVLVAAERVRAAISDRTMSAGNATLTCQVSVGIACSSHGKEPAGGLVRAADEALYLAKNGGRNKVCVLPGDGGVILPPRPHEAALA